MESAVVCNMLGEEKSGVLWQDGGEEVL